MRVRDDSRSFDQRALAKKEKREHLRGRLESKILLESLGFLLKGECGNRENYLLSFKLELAMEPLEG